MQRKMKGVSVKVATRTEAGRVVDALVLAFARDPVTRWVFPEAAQHIEGFAEFVSAFGGAAFDRGTAFVTEGFGGAALWLPPGSEPDEAGVVATFERFVPPERLETALAFMEEMGRYHPHEVHWYLPLIGVDPWRQGHGIGAALLRHALDRIDREGTLAYLESTNPANVSLYRRHGFEVMGTIQVGDAPAIVPMLRHPR